MTQYTLRKGAFVIPLTTKELELLMANQSISHSSFINKDLEKTVEPWYFTNEDILSRRIHEGLILVRLPVPQITSTHRSEDIVAFEAMIQDIQEDK